MPVIKVYQHGLTAGCPPSRKNHTPPPRSTVGGWSQSSIRRNTTFLYSVDDSSLTGHGLALTLTVGDCPASSDEWHRLRRSLEHWLRRRGLTRLHWVVEWQRRGVPHLHAAAWFNEPPSPSFIAAIASYWSDLTSHLGTKLRAQSFVPISDAVGWFRYVSKHAARGLSHYQRSPENVPPLWHGRTGRMWGKVGDWPTREALRLDVPLEAFHALRRIVRRWRISDARHALHTAKTPSDSFKARKRLTSARRMLQSTEQKHATIRGLSEWLGIDATLRLVGLLSDNGHEVTQSD